MKIIVLAILFILLITRIKNTPINISKKRWTSYVQKEIEHLKKNEYIEDKGFKGFSLIIYTLVQLLFIIFYTYLGTKFNTKLFINLSALQVCSCIFYLIYSSKSICSLNIEDYKFHRWIFLFNSILDYIYYPMAIYMLLK